MVGQVLEVRYMPRNTLRLQSWTFGWMVELLLNPETMEQLARDGVQHFRYIELEMSMKYYIAGLYICLLK